MIKDTTKDKISTLIDQTGFNLQFVYLFLIIGAEGFCECYTLTFSILAAPFIETSLPRDIAEVVLKSSMFAGMLLSVFLVELLQGLSPKTSILSTAILASCFSSFYFFSSSVVLISIANFVLGFSYGAMLVGAYSLTADLICSKLRPLLVTWVWLLFPLGGLTACWVIKATAVLEHPENIREATTPLFFIVFL